jgi:hypothetical protein
MYKLTHNTYMHTHSTVCLDFVFFSLRVRITEVKHLSHNKDSDAVHARNLPGDTVHCDAAATLGRSVTGGGLIVAPAGECPKICSYAPAHRHNIRDIQTA